MKKNSIYKVQPVEVRGYSVCPAVKNMVNKMGWKDLTAGAYLLAVEGLTAQGTYTVQVRNIISALTEIFPGLTPRSVKTMLTRAIEVGTIRPDGTSPDGAVEFYALTAHGEKVAAEVREAASEFAAWERTLPTGHFSYSLPATQKSQIAALTAENHTLANKTAALTKKVSEQSERIAELEAILASVTSRP